MRFFVDRCFPVQLCAALTALHDGCHQIQYHDDHFANDTSDTAWLKAVGSWKPKPIVISGDTRILKRRDEVHELVAQDLMFVCLAPGWTETPIDEYAWRFMKAWSGIVAAVSKCNESCVFTVNHGASLKTELYKVTRQISAK